jgi:HEAT repeat protein
VARNAPFVDALGKQGGPEVADILAQSLATGVLAEAGPDARPPLLEGVAAWGLARLHTRAARAYLADVGDLRERRPAAAWRIAGAMATDPDSSYQRPLLTLLEHPDRFARAAAARALGKQHDHRLVAPLVQHLSDLDWQVRASILLALCELADRRNPDRDAAEFSAALLADSQPLVREAAVAALDSFGVGPHRALLEKCLADAVPAVRLGAARALCRAAGLEARPIWDATRADSVEFVRTDSRFRTLGVLETAAADMLLPLLQNSTVQERIRPPAARRAGAPRPRRVAARRRLSSAPSPPTATSSSLRPPPKRSASSALRRRSGPRRGLRNTRAWPRGHRCAAGGRRSRRRQRHRQAAQSRTRRRGGALRGAPRRSGSARRARRHRRARQARWP